MRVTPGLIRLQVMGGSCDLRIVWQDSHLTRPCQALTQFAMERMALQKRGGLKRGELIVLYAVLWSFGSIAARSFSSTSYKMKCMNQFSDLRHCYVQLSGCKIEPNAGGRGKGHSLTSVPFACSGHSVPTACSRLPL